MRRLGPGGENVRGVCALVEGRLGEMASEYAVGDGFTVVDAFLVLIYCWASRLDSDMETGFPRYTSYVKRLLERPSVVEARKVHVGVR